MDIIIGIGIGLVTLVTCVRAARWRQSHVLVTGVVTESWLRGTKYALGTRGDVR